MRFISGKHDVGKFGHYCQQTVVLTMSNDASAFSSTFRVPNRTNFSQSLANEFLAVPPTLTDIFMFT